MCAILYGKCPEYTKLDVCKRLQKHGIDTIFAIKYKSKPAFKMPISQLVTGFGYLPYRIAHLLNVPGGSVHKCEDTVEKLP